MTKLKTRDLVMISSICAIIAILTFTPMGFWTLGIVSVTVVHIPVLIGCYLYGKKGGLIFGLAFGIASLLNVVRGTTADQTFIYPWVSILPRMVFGLAAGIMFEMIKKKTVKTQLIFIPIICFIATYVFHTWVVFLPYIYTFSYMIQNVAMTKELMITGLTIFASNGAFEALAATLIVPAIIYALDPKFRDHIHKKNN